MMNENMTFLILLSFETEQLSHILKHVYTI